MSLNLLMTADCTPSDCDEGMQPKGFSASTMWQSLMHRVVHVLADFQMAFAAARELVVERMRQFGQFGLRHQVMRDAAQILDRAVIEEIPHLLAGADAPQFLA